MVDEVINPYFTRGQQQLDKLAVLHNAHKVLPPKINDESSEVAILKNLRADSDILKKIMRFRGFILDGNKWVQFRNPVMNDLGIANMIQVLYAIEDFEFSHADETKVNQWAYHLLESNFPTFTVYHEDFALDKKDFNIIYTELFSFIVSIFNKAKGAGHRNVVRGTYSEEALAKMLSNSQREQQRGFLQRLRGGQPSQQNG